MDCRKQCDCHRTHLTDGIACPVAVSKALNEPVPGSQKGASAEKMMSKFVLSVVVAAAHLLHSVEKTSKLCHLTDMLKAREVVYEEL